MVGVALCNQIMCAKKNRNKTCNLQNNFWRLVHNKEGIFISELKKDLVDYYTTWNLAYTKEGLCKQQEGARHDDSFESI